MAHINISSLRNKFDMLTNGVTEYIDILMTFETKFPHVLYNFKSFSIPYRLDRNSHGGGMLVYVRDNIPSNLVKFDEGLKTWKVSLLN